MKLDYNYIWLITLNVILCGSCIHAEEEKEKFWISCAVYEISGNNIDLCHWLMNLGGGIREYSKLSIMSITNKYQRQYFEIIADEIAPDIVRIKGRIIAECNDVKISCPINIIRQIDGKSEYVLISEKDDVIFADKKGKYYCYNIQARRRNKILDRANTLFNLIETVTKTNQPNGVRSNNSSEGK